MAQKRMFSNQIVDTDAFLDLPVESQLFYFHLGMKADVKGFVEPKKVARLVGIKIESLKPLIQAGFVIVFESGVVVITHWEVNNNIREAYEAPTRFEKELAQLSLHNNEYSLLQQNYSSSTAELLPRLDKIRLDKDSNTVPPKGDTTKYNGYKKEYIQDYIDFFNKLFNSNFRVTPARENKLKLRFKTYTGDEILKALQNLSKSKFHQGDNDRGWKADPDFLIRNDEQIDIWLNKKGSKNDF